MKLLNRYTKGQYEYAAFNKKKSILIAAAMFSLSLIIYFTGVTTTGSNKNLLTIVAVLGMLPASKLLVAAIMSLRVKVVDEEVKNEIDEATQNLNGFYHMYFTSYDKNFAISHMIVNKKVLICFYEDQKFNKDAFKEHIETMMKRAGHSNIVVSVTNDIEKYCHMLSDLDTNLTDSEIAIDDEIRISLYEICL